MKKGKKEETALTSGHRIDLALILHTRRRDNPTRLIIELRIVFFTRSNAIEKEGGTVEGEWWTGGANLTREKREDSSFLLACLWRRYVGQGPFHSDPNRWFRRRIQFLSEPRSLRRACKCSFPGASSRRVLLSSRWTATLPSAFCSFPNVCCHCFY